MRRLASVLLVVLLASLTGVAGPLELWIGGGPAATSLDELTAAIVVFNTLIGRLNEEFEVNPDVTGFVPDLDPMSSSLTLRAGERYWLTSWFSLGGQVEYITTSTSTFGQYQGSDTSTIDIALDFRTIDFLLSTRFVFLDVGLQLGAEAGIGYYHSVVERSVTFEVPVEFSEALSGVPPEGSGRFSGGAIGFEAGVSLTYPLTSWFTLGSLLTYRSASVPTLTNGQGALLDIDGNGTSESVNLSGITVQLTFSINIDLSLDERKE